MKERPILFSAPMVRALLDGSKTQTRRVVKYNITGPNPPGATYDWRHPKTNEWMGAHGGRFQFCNTNAALLCPYGQPGDRLWVRETWGYIDPDCSGQDVEGENDDGVRGGPCRVFHDDMMREGSVLRDYWRRRVAYAASWQEPKFGNGPDAPKRWRPSIHMPRWASRISLEVTGVRVERLQDISAADALAEGITLHPDHHSRPRDSRYGPVATYKDLWDSINGPGSWAANPWVWVISFSRQGEIK